MLLALFFIHIWVEGNLIAHGAALWIYYYTAICFALIGLAFGLTGHGWVRQSSTIVSLVMVFQWSGQMAVSTLEDFLITVAMYFSLAVVGIIFSSLPTPTKGRTGTVVAPNRKTTRAPID
jgi:hypothetical protein